MIEIVNYAELSLVHVHRSTLSPLTPCPGYQKTLVATIPVAPNTWTNLILSPFLHVENCV